MNDVDKLTVALAQLDALRDTLKKEPASDWFIDARDFVERSDMAPAQRLAGAMRLLETAWAKLETGPIMCSLAVLHEQWVEISAPLALPPA